MRFGEPVVGEPCDPRPCHAVVLTAAPERALPEFGDEEAEGGERRTVCRHRVVVKVSGDDLSQPFSLHGHWLMNASSQFLFDGLQLRRIRSRRDFRLIWNLPRRDLLQIKVKPRKSKVSGLPSPRCLRFFAAKRPNSISRVFSGCSDSANFPNRSRIASRKRRASALVLEAHDEVSRAVEFHRRALAEPDVRLAPHPAPIVRPRP